MSIEDIIRQDRPAQEIIADLKQKSIIVPAWSKLEKQYNTDKHEVMDTERYPDKMDTKTGVVTKQSRVTLGLEKLAVKRMTGLAFGIPVKRTYQPQNDREKLAAEIMEDIFHRNRINSLNIERSKLLYASCEVATIWYKQPVTTKYAGQASPVKLRHRTYSPKNGDNLYPLFDDYDDLIAFSVEYTRTTGAETTTFFDTYTANQHIRWKEGTGDATGYVEELREEISIMKIPFAYRERDLPIWEKQSRNVEEIEMKLSKEGNYINKNARPTFAIYSDNKLNDKKEDNSNGASRNVLRFGKDDRAEYVTWAGAYETTKHYTDELKKNFFTELQLPDLSFENMKTVAMSGEARKMVFIDAQLKVLEESGAWLEFFSREVNIVRAYMKEMYPSLSEAIDTLRVDIEITPYQISDEREEIANLTNATGGKPIMSQRTAIRRGGFVQDVDEEIKQINEESDVVVDIFNQEPAQ